MPILRKRRNGNANITNDLGAGDCYNRFQNTPMFGKHSLDLEAARFDSSFFVSTYELLNLGTAETFGIARAIRAILLRESVVLVVTHNSSFA
jgi:hypothetical protein